MNVEIKELPKRCQVERSGAGNRAVHRKVCPSSEREREEARDVLPSFVWVLLEKEKGTLAGQGGLVPRSCGK